MTHDMSYLYPSIRLVIECHHQNTTLVHPIQQVLFRYIRNIQVWSGPRGNNTAQASDVFAFTKSVNYGSSSSITQNVRHVVFYGHLSIIYDDLRECAPVVEDGVSSTLSRVQDCHLLAPGLTCRFSLRRISGGFLL